MSLFKTVPRSPTTAPYQSNPTARSLGLALFLAIACTGLAGPAVAESAVPDIGKPQTNFRASLERLDDRRPPSRSLWAMIKDARGADPVNIEPTAAAPSSRALMHEDADDDAADDIPDPIGSDVYDPLEPVNRVIFGFNEVVDLVVLTPVSHVYRTVVPEPLRIGVRNALHNWSTPIILANDLLQGKPDKATTTFVRFLVNSTAGFGGIVDAASAAGLPRHSEDFGQTLAVWGVESGPYLVLPVLGPSNFRDTVGLAVDSVTHPATWLMWNLDTQERLAPAMAFTVSGHEEFLDEADALRSTSPDFYATIRGVYTQRRNAAIANGSFGFDTVDGAPSDDFDDVDLESLPPIPTE